jgi:uncharacterized Ntn-hydrolase superfamily protein
MTFSIVAVDRDNKEIGFAIASCTWDAGMVGTAKAELGALCSQAQGYYPFHSILYEKLEEKKSLSEVLEEFHRVDENIQNRQVGMVSFAGEALAFTGEKCEDWAGHIIGDDYAIQGNILTGPNVIQKMAEAFEASDGMLAERLYAALQAGDDVGGDIRGKMSARVLVKKKGTSLEDTYIDLTVEDHDEPIQEIGRLLAVRRKIYKAYLLQMAIMKADEQSKVKALKEMDTYLSDKVDRTVIDYHSFVGETALELGLDEMAVNAFRRVVKIGPRLAGHFRKQKETGEMPEALVDKILMGLS